MGKWDVSTASVTSLSEFLYWEGPLPGVKCLAPIELVGTALHLV